MARRWRPEPEVLHALHNIFGVARYERMLLLRTTRFRILGSVGVVLPLLIGIGLAVLEARGIEFSSALGMGAFIPFYVYSYLQAVVIAFIVGDFRAADERAEIYEVIAGRPISTAELVIGKYLGVVGAMSTLSVGALTARATPPGDAGWRALAGTRTNIGMWTSSSYLNTRISPRKTPTRNHSRGSSGTAPSHRRFGFD